MKEYKVVKWKMGLSYSTNNKNLEEILNQYAREGWQVNHIAEHTARVVFERDKNR